MPVKHDQNFLIGQKYLQEVDLPPVQKIKLTAKSSYRQRVIRKVWNSYGGLLEKLSLRLKIDPAVAVAVFCVETKGKGFASDGRMIIRFESHIFYRYWGRFHPVSFSDHFRFDQRKPWRGHKFRKSKESKWEAFHQKGQPGEWEAFKFARTKHQGFAMYSISMGMPQIMGFNYQKIGYRSAKKMFDSFSRSQRSQIIGLFDFIQKATSGMDQALHKRDFYLFAKLYNGTGKAKVYADRIKSYHDLFQKLIQTKNY